MGLFYSDNKFEIETIIEIMRISCEDWNTRFGDSNKQVIGIRDEGKQTLETVLDVSEKILDNLFSGSDSSAFKKVAAFMVVSSIYPFLFARTEGDTEGLLNLAGKHIKNFQAYFNVESAPLLLSLAEQETDGGKYVLLDQWAGFPTIQAIEENCKFLASISQIARVHKPGCSIEFDGWVIGIQILALSLILENAYWAKHPTP